MPEVTIITTVYNKELLIDKCILSVLSQTFTDFEYILVDDESPDNCPEICDRYAENDERIKVIHRDNGGHALAYNSGIMAAKGDYILLVDADDYLSSSDALIEMIKIAKYYKTDIVVSDFLNIWNANNKPKLLSCSGIEMLEYLIEDNIYHPTTRSRLFSKNVIQKTGLLKNLISDDEEWTPRAFYFADKVAIYPSSIYTRTTPEDSVTMISSEKNQIRKANDKAVTAGELIDFFEEVNLPTESKRKIYKRIVSLYLSSVYIYINDVKTLRDKEKLVEVLNDYSYVLNYTYYYKCKRHTLLSLINKMFGLHGFILSFYLFNFFKRK